MGVAAQSGGAQTGVAQTRRFQPDWAERVVALAPMLRACLDGAGPAAFVAGATPLERDGWRVVLRDGAATADCILRDGAVAERVPLPDAPPPDPATPAFFAERRCVDARRVDAPEGTVLGWLAYPGC